MCFLSFEDQIVLRRTNTNKIISTFWRTALSLFWVLNGKSFEKCSPKLVILVQGHFSFALNSEIKENCRTENVETYCPFRERTTWSEIYCKKRWSFYTCRLHGSNIGQGGNVKPAIEGRFLVKQNEYFFFKVFLKSEIVYWNRLQLLSFSFRVWTFLKSEQMMRQRHTGTFRVFTKMHTVKKDVICYTHVSSVLLGWPILRVGNHLLPLIELTFLLKHW